MEKGGNTEIRENEENTENGEDTEIAEDREIRENTENREKKMRGRTVARAAICVEGGGGI